MTILYQRNLSNGYLTFIGEFGSDAEAQSYVNSHLGMFTNGYTFEIHH